MDRAQTFTDSEIIKDVNLVEDQVHLSKRIRFFRTMKKWKRVKWGLSSFKTGLPKVHDVYDKWANI